jgi:alkylhydroperoxidase/carboxymuconolactone decarboxylase family protein YurZ
MMYNAKSIAVIFLSFILMVSSDLIAQDKDSMESAETVISHFEMEFGFIPKPLLLLSERPGTVPAFMKYGKTLMAGGPLTPREINLVTLSAAVALRSAGCTDNQIRKLKKMDVSNEEIIQVIMLAAVLANTSTLTEAYETLVLEAVLQKD